jgi:hypothetical protein
VSSSGIGDGEYRAYTTANKDSEIVGIRIVYLDDDNDGDNTYEEDTAEDINY